MRHADSRTNSRERDGMRRLAVLSIGLAAVIVAGCRSAASQPAPPQVATEPVSSAAPPPALPADLAGTAWRLVRIQSMDDTVTTPDDPAKYTFDFGADGRASLRLDCNRGSGKWESPGRGELRIGPLAMTRAMCPPGSLSDRVARDMGYVRSFTLKDGRLFLALMADGGIYELEPRAVTSPQ